MQASLWQLNLQKKTKKKNNCWFEECLSRLMTCVYITHVCIYHIYLYVNIYLLINLACIFDSVMAMFCLSIGVCFEYVQHSRSLVNGHGRKTNSSRNQISVLQWISSVSQRLRDSRFDLPSTLTNKYQSHEERILDPVCSCNRSNVPKIASSTISYKHSPHFSKSQSISIGRNACLLFQSCP